jgi:hypothetical protein
MKDLQKFSIKSPHSYMDSRLSVTFGFKLHEMKTLYFALVPGMLVLASCGNNNSSDKTTTADTVKAKPMPAVALAPVSASPDFPGATLMIKNVKAEKAGADSAKVTFNFDVKNYELKLQTSDNANKMCNNSDKGQHIHFILDNAPYKALYEPTNEVTLVNDGKEHYLVAFLSRSYHESIKSKGAAVVYHFKIDEKGNLKKLDDPKTPMLVYSRPKGDYMGKDTANVLLDFYVINDSLSAAGHMVKAEIANMDKPAQQLTTTLNVWEPRFIQNLGTGKCKVTLSLVDKDGKSIEGPQVSATREFNLKAQ